MAKTEECRTEPDIKIFSKNYYAETLHYWFIDWTQKSLRLLKKAKAKPFKRTRQPQNKKTLLNKFTQKERIAHLESPENIIYIQICTKDIKTDQKMKKNIQLMSIISQHKFIIYIVKNSKHDEWRPQRDTQPAALSKISSLRSGIFVNTCLAGKLKNIKLLKTDQGLYSYIRWRLVLQAANTSSPRCQWKRAVNQKWVWFAFHWKRSIINWWEWDSRRQWEQTFWNWSLARIR